MPYFRGEIDNHSVHDFSFTDTMTNITILSQRLYWAYIVLFTLIAVACYTTYSAYNAQNAVQAAMAQSKQKETEANEKIKAAEQTVQIAKEEVGNLQAEKDTLARQIADAEEQRTKAKQETIGAEKQAEKAKKAAGDAKKKYDDMAKQKELAEEKIKNASTSQQELTKKNEELRKKNFDLEGQVKKLNEEMDGYKNILGVSDQSDNGKDVLDAIKKLSAELSKYEGDTAQLNSEIKKLTDVNRKLVTEKNASQRQFNGIKSDYQKYVDKKWGYHPTSLGLKGPGGNY